MSELPEGWVRTTLGDTTTHRSGNGKLIKGKQHAEAVEGLFPAFSASGQDIWVETPEHSGAAVVVSGVYKGRSFRSSRLATMKLSWTGRMGRFIATVK